MGSQQGGWTVVRHGRKGRRPLQPYPNISRWDRGDECIRGKDRAPPVPFWEQAQSRSPNQPVPPAESACHRGSQSDSLLRQAAAPEFGRLVRKIHSVIKIVHHLQNVTPKEGRDEPKSISKMVQVLTFMINPACPTEDTMDRICGNARNWGYTTLMILKEHYTQNLEMLLGELPALMTPNWGEAFQVATRWAKRNLPRITQDVLDHVEALITSMDNINRDSHTEKDPPTPQDPTKTPRRTPKRTPRQTPKQRLKLTKSSPKAKPASIPRQTSVTKSVTTMMDQTPILPRSPSPTQEKNMTPEDVAFMDSWLAKERSRVKTHIGSATSKQERLFTPQNKDSHIDKSQDEMSDYSVLSPTPRQPYFKRIPLRRISRRYKF